MKSLHNLYEQSITESITSDYVSLFKKFYDTDNIKVKLKKDGVEVKQGSGSTQFFKFDGFLEKLAKDSSNRLSQKQWNAVWAIANKLGHK